MKPALGKASPEPVSVREAAGEKGGLGARLPALDGRRVKELCGIPLAYTGEPCARSAGHAGGKGGAHRSRYVMDNDARMRRGKWAAA